MYYRTPTLDARLSLASDLIRSVIPRPSRAGEHPHADQKTWNDIDKEFRDLLSVRNRIAHEPGLADFREPLQSQLKDRGIILAGWIGGYGLGRKQLTLATAGFERYAKTTRRAAFLAEMERVVRWSALCELIAPVCPKPGNGRPPVGVERICGSIFCSNGSTCRTRPWRRRFAIRGRCAVLSGSISAASCIS